MNVFEAVKQSVTTRQAAERYGIKVNRNGMCVCPFHNDKNPSSNDDEGAVAGDVVNGIVVEDAGSMDWTPGSAGEEGWH